MKEWSTKDFRKAAFAVGFGLTLGKCFGKLVGDVVNSTIVHSFQKLAKNGNETAQEICRKAGVEYEEPKDKDSEIQMGFHG